MQTIKLSAGAGAGAYVWLLSIILIMGIHREKAGVLFQSALAGDQPREGVLSQSFIYSIPTFSLLPRIILQVLLHWIGFVISHVMGTNRVIFHECAVHGQSCIIYALLFLYHRHITENGYCAQFRVLVW